MGLNRRGTKTMKRKKSLGRKYKKGNPKKTRNIRANRSASLEMMDCEDDMRMEVEDETPPQPGDAPNIDMQDMLIRPDQLAIPDPKPRAPYRVPDVQLSITLHGSNTGHLFEIPENFEVVIFTRRGQLLFTDNISKVMKWIGQNSEAIRNSDFHDYHLKKLVFKTCARRNAGIQALFEKYRRTNRRIFHPRFNQYRSSNTATIQIFRHGGPPCPNISLNFDETMLTTNNAPWGLYVFNPFLMKPDLINRQYFTKFPPATTFHLSSLIEYMRGQTPHENIKRRLFLFCCRAFDAVPAGVNSPESSVELQEI